VTLTNVPRIRDVDTMLELLSELGSDACWTGPNEVRVHTAAVNRAAPDPRLCSTIRASFLLAGPLLARFRSATMPPPGGDVIGRRRMDTHFLALRALGAEVGYDHHTFDLRTTGLKGADIFLDEPSVTATENALMAAALAKGTTRIRNAAAEPHVQDLCHMLVGMGAAIRGIGTNTLEIDGRDRLGGGRFRVTADHIEVGSFIGLAAVTRGEILIEDAAPEHLDSTRLGFARLGVRVEIRGSDVFVPADQEMRIEMDLGGYIPKIDDGPWPAFPADLTSIALVTATQCDGTILIHEKMFESRMFFTDKLVAMGARMILCDPHRVVVVGPSRLRGAVVESPDIRAGMGLLIAALGAHGTSEIFNIGQIERGFQNIDQRLQDLGADIERVDSREN
jgi:UDP-N-acetylglucosamine 1-carboxyvinyltransferase